MPTDTRSSSKERAARVGAVWLWVWPGDPRYWLTFVYLLSALARNVSLYLVACNLYLLLSVAVCSLVCLSLFAFRNLTKIPFIPRSTISVCLMFFRDSVLVLVFLFLVFGFCFLRYLLSRFLPLFLSKRFFLWLLCLPFCVRQRSQHTWVHVCHPTARVPICIEFFGIESNRYKPSAKRTEKHWDAVGPNELDF